MEGSKVIAGTADGTQYGGRMYEADLSEDNEVVLVNGHSSVSLMDTAHYVAGVTLPSDVVQGEDALALSIRIRDIDMIIYLRK